MSPTKKTFTRDELLDLAKAFVREELEYADKKDRMLYLGILVHFIVNQFEEKP